MDRKIRLIIIEDSEEVGKMIVSRLEENPYVKYETRWLKKTVNALKSIYDFDPDIVILDLKLPDGNGFNILRQIRPDLSHSLIIVFSMLSEMRNRCIKAGCDYFFDKVNGLEDLMYEITRFSLREAKTW